MLKVIDTLTSMLKSLVLFGFVTATAVYAQSNGSGNTQPQAPYSSDEVIRKVISEIVQSVDKAFTSLGNQALNDAGQTILWMLIAVLIAWYALRSYIGNGMTSFLEEAITLFLIVGVVQLLLWSGGIEGIEKFISSIASSIAGEQLSDLPTALNSVLNQTFTAAKRVLSMPSIKSDSGFSVGQILTAIPQTIAQYIAKFIAVGFMILGASVYVANIILAYGMIVIAKALAPIMLPWLLLPQASFLFDGWLRFFIGACLIKVIGAFFIKLTNNWITSIVDLSQNVLINSNVDPYTLYIGNLLIYMAIAFMAAVVAYLMIMLPAIASGIISGSTARAGFSGMSTLTGGAGGRGIQQGLAAPSKAGMSAAKALDKISSKMAETAKSTTKQKTP